MNEYLIELMDESLICEYIGLNEYLLEQYSPYYDLFDSYAFDYMEWD